ncbi:putative membrane protein [Rhodococcus opacus]|uniref:Putative membrane protein n=1 Tax=Rhodococcus opacus TaxID=37919 RepID=A0A1B1KFA1_RHOOP|nr:putative membrane protein [Rhodococcus opacus]
MTADSRPRNRITFVVLSVSVLVFALLQSFVLPVLSAINSELHTDQATVTWVLALSRGS